MTPLPALSVVIATRGRREAVTSLVTSLQHQCYDGDLELVVACDGDLDGTSDALRALTVGRRPTVVRLADSGNDPHAGRGAGAARNAGAAAAAGTLLLFLDDDVATVDDQLLLLHGRAHAGPTEQVVVGACPPRAQWPDAWLARSIAAWWDRHTRHLTGGAELRFSDMATANVSMPATVFQATGGFRALPRREDWDLGLRLQLARVPMVSLPAASVDHVSDTDVRTYLADVRREAAGDAFLVEAHPFVMGALPIDAYRRAGPLAVTTLRRAMSGAPARAAGRVSPAALDAIERLSRREPEKSRAHRAWLQLLRRAVTVHYWAGVGDALPGLQGLERLDLLCAAADEAARATTARFDVASGALKLPGPQEACEVPVVNGAARLGIAPMRWGGLPFDERRFRAHVARRLTR